MILKLGMKHLAIKLYKVCINHDPGMTSTFFTARSTSIRSPIFLNGKKIGKCHLMVENLLGMSKWAENLCL